jgi:hypothetical protein
VDVAWQMLLKAYPGVEISSMQEILGANVPIMGGYTLGQVGAMEGETPKFLNQHIVVIVFGEPEAA